MRQNLIIFMKMKQIIIFMDPKSYDQINIKKETVGEKGKNANRKLGG